MPNGSDPLETLAEPETDHTGSVGSGAGASTPGLVVLWSADEPGFAGAWLPVPAGTGFLALGRGPSRPDDEHPRLGALQQRPGENRPLAPLQSQALSRLQLLVRRAASSLELVNVGKRRLAVNGEPSDRGVAEPGDVIELGSQLLLMCALRPRVLPGTVGAVHAFGAPDAYGYVGESPAAWQLRAELGFAAPRAGHVLILGATGTGKELVAQALHAASKRAGPLVSRNAATLPEALVDAELFGNLKGYPNPGMPERRGLIGAADGGSLFLDEFADLPVAAQAHVLRVLDGGEYQRLGEDSARRSSFRLIAATNRPEAVLRADVAARFDFRIRTPDLALRREDVPLIARHLLRGMAEGDPELARRFALASDAPRLGFGLLRRLVRHDYTGNVRELRQLLWRSLSASQGDSLEWPVAPPGGGDEPSASGADAESALGPGELQRALDANNGSLEKTWRALGLANRHVLARLVRKYGLVVSKTHPRG